MLLFGKKSRIKILIDQNDLFSLFHFYFNVLFRKYTHESDYATREEQQDLLKQ